MPYAIKGQKGNQKNIIIIGTTSDTEADAWGRLCSPGYISHYEELGYSCVPVTVSEGEAETLLRRLRGFLADTNHHTHHYIESGEQSSDLHEWVLEIDAYLKGKP